MPSMHYPRYSGKLLFALILLLLGTFWISKRPDRSNKRPRLGQDIQTHDKALSTIATPLAPTSSEAMDAMRARVGQQYGKLPLSFEANLGQVDGSVKYLARGGGCDLFLTSTEAVFSLSGTENVRVSEKLSVGPLGDIREPKAEPAVLRMKLLGAKHDAKVTGLGEQSGKSNYFLGNDPAKWHTNVTHYSRVRYTDIYPGVDLVYYGSQRQLEYDFVIAPGSSPDKIKLAFEGASQVDLDTDGALRLHTSAGELRQHRPVVYQNVAGERKEISGHYVIKGQHEIGFEIAEYDLTQPLVIDPVLSYSTYLGGNNNDAGFGITVDSLGNAYVTGMTNSANFPAVNSLPHGPENGYTFITKLNAAGSALVYSTYVGGLGGSFSTEQGNSIAVDSAGNAYVTGSTRTDDFPTVNAYQPALKGGGDAFVLKLSATGSALLYSTYLGGTAGEEGRGIAVDATGNAYVIGRTVSTDFPTTNALQPVPGGNTCDPSNPCYDAFVTKFASSGSTLVYSTYLGGERREFGDAIAVDAANNAYVTGSTNSPNFPTTANALQKNYSDLGTNSEEYDAFVAKLNPSGSAFVYSTYLGGALGTDEGKGIAVDSAGNAYVAGDTSTGTFPTVNAVQPAIGPGGNGAGSQFSDAFVSKLNATGSALVYSTFLGGGGPDAAQSVAIDSAGNAYVTGYTLSFNFPVANAFQPNPSGEFAYTGDAFITKLSASGSAFVYSSFLGGGSGDTGNDIAVDSTGNAYVTGSTTSQDFPTANPMQTTLGGGTLGDAFVTKISDNAQPAVLSVSALLPDRAGNTGAVSVTVHGSGFVTGVKMKLVQAGQPDIPSIFVGLSQNGTVARSRFNLNGRAAGVRDIVVTNPDGATFTLPNAFTVEEGGKPHVWVDIVGRGNIRPGEPQKYYVIYGNSGNTEAYGVPLFIRGIPKHAQVELGFAIRTPPQLPGHTPIDYSQVPVVIENDTEKIIALYLPIVRVGASSFLQITLTATLAEGDFQLEAYTQPPQYTPSPSQSDSGGGQCGGSGNSNGSKVWNHGAEKAEGTGLDCGFQAADEAVSLLGAAGMPLSCLPSSLVTMADLIHELANTYCTDEVDTYSYVQLTAGLVVTALECAGRAETFGRVISAAQAIIGLPHVIASCGEFFVKLFIHLIFGSDPNDKFGAQGIGSARYLSGAEPLRYAVFFENKPEATGPAQTVVVTDQLDAAKLDLKTFSLGPIFFGVDRKVIPPSGLSEYTADVDLRPQKNLIVHVEAKLDKTSGLLTWRFSSLDPATGLPTDDPVAGFLPPNRTPPEGEAQVLFTVQAKSEVATGTEVRNKARIVFDTNAPIDTPEWLNTIDNSKPISRVQSLPAIVPYSFIVSWSGSDTGAGLDSYTVLVSEDGGTFTPWITNTRTTSAVFTGSVNRSYRFFSIARDAVGNEEEVKTNADATTTVSVPPGNAIDEASFFLSQHYRDFLNREPDPSGFLFWTNEFKSCGTDAHCIEVKRINVSAAFFLSIEFQETGYLVERIYKASYGDATGTSTFGGTHQLAVPIVRFNEFLPDTQTIGQAVVVGQPGWQQVLENNKQAFTAAFVQRTRFAGAYPTTLSPDQFVDMLFANAGVTPSATDRNAAVNEFGAAGNTADTAARGRALRRVAENSILNQQEKNKAFVLMQYFGYLRRNPNDLPDADHTGYDFWLGKLNQFNGNFVSAEMVKAFIVSGEYRQRFGP